MKRLLLIFCLWLLASVAFSQYKWEYGTMIGAANYLGEIGGKEKTRRNFILDLKLSQMGMNHEPVMVPLGYLKNIIS